MGVTAAVVGGVAALTSAGVGIATYEAGQQAAAAAKSLANQQQSELQSQQEQEAALRAQQAGAGSTFGEETGGGALSTGFGFGTAPAASPNAGRGQITGMG